MIDLLRDAIQQHLSAGRERYARIKDMPGQLDLFGAGKRRSTKVQASLKWDEKKHPRDESGKFSEHAGSKKPKKPASPKADQSGSKRTSENPDSRAEWTEHEGSLALRIPGSKFVAVAANGQQDAKNFAVYDTSSDSYDPVEYLPAGEVHGWLERNADDVPETDFGNMEPDEDTDEPTDAGDEVAEDSGEADIDDGDGSEADAAGAEDTGDGEPETEGYPEDFSIAQHIKIAAEDVGSLRKTDVFRVLEWAPDEHRQAVADHITENREDLADEVADSLAELADEPEADAGADELAYTPEAATDAWIDAQGDPGFIRRRESLIAHTRRLAKRLNGWQTSDELTVKDRQGRRDVARTSDTLKEMRETGHVQIAWDNTGMPHYAWGNEDLPDWLTKSTDDSDMAGLPGKNTATDNDPETPEGSGDEDGPLPEAAINAGIKSWKDARKKGVTGLIKRADRISEAAAREVATYLNNPMGIARRLAQMWIEATAMTGNGSEGARIAADRLRKQYTAESAPGIKEGNARAADAFLRHAMAKPEKPEKQSDALEDFNDKVGDPDGIRVRSTTLKNQQHPSQTTKSNPACSTRQKIVTKRNSGRNRNWTTTTPSRVSRPLRTQARIC